MTMHRITASIALGCVVPVALACSAEQLTSTGLEPSSGAADEVASPDEAASSAESSDPASSEPDPSGTDSDSADDPGASLSNEGALPQNLAGVDDGADDSAEPPPADDAEDPEPDVVEEEPEEVVEEVVPLTPAQVGGELEGFLHLSPCESQDFGHDCTLPQCQGGTKLVERTLQLGGDPEVIYDLTIHVYGVVEPRSYQGGVRRAGNNFDVNGLDFWYEGGGLPGNLGTYNSYEMHVDPPVPGAPNDYFLNSRTGGDQTWLIRLDYEATIPVRGGGTIGWRSFDPNCRQITNCEDTECGPLGPKPVTLPSVSGANPPPPATFSQPFQTSANAGRGQWVYIDVTDVVARP